MHAEWCSTPHLARLIPATPVGDTVMPDRRQVATRAIVAAGVYLHPNYYVGDQDKRLTAIQSDSPIADIDADFLESWMWAKHPSLAAALENSIFEAFDDTTMT
jgi:hypothetical protein